MRVIGGNDRQQYWRLWDYCEIIRRLNNGSTAKLKVERTSLHHAPIFQRLFVVYAAQSRGFIAGCRPIICLDACHPNGPLGG